ncbi:MAG: alpha-hydroxy-acid oxidizing enzyme [Deltaproteobacteria bacterium]|nr:alpha-hydroxy-acid oxidizing enzyme [Deltaproteobacteria bacterium]
MEPISVFDFEEVARERLATMVYDYYRSGAADEITLRRNREAFDSTRLYPRVLIDVESRSLTSTVLGQSCSMPILVAPTAFHGLAHPDAEAATAAAAGEAGTIMVLSSLSNTAVEDVVAASSGSVWFQLYVYKDRGVTAELVRRVEEAGCRALVLTVDAPVLGTRERDERNRFHLPAGLSVRNLASAGFDPLPETGGSGLASYFQSLLAADLSWKDVEWLRSLTSLPIVLKGIVRRDDARRAVDAGVHGLVVSNHGGRQLDSAPATLEALSGISEAVDERITVLMDGGVRRGTDVVKALARGASGVLVGRPVLWGLAADGRAGVAQVLSILRRELDHAMALCGCASVAEINGDLLHPG